MLYVLAWGASVFARALRLFCNSVILMPGACILSTQSRVIEKYLQCLRLFNAATWGHGLQWHFMNSVVLRTVECKALPQLSPSVTVCGVTLCGSVRKGLSPSTCLAIHLFPPATHNMRWYHLRSASPAGGAYKDKSTNSIDFCVCVLRALARSNRSKQSKSTLS